MARTPRWGQPGRTVAVYLPQEQVDVLTELAKAEQTSVSELIRRAIRQRFILGSDVSAGNVSCKAS